MGLSLIYVQDHRKAADGHRLDPDRLRLRQNGVDDEVDLAQALDQLYREIQQNLNHSQVSVREMSRLADDDEFKDCVPIHFAVLDYCDVLSGLFGELTQVSKDVLGKPGKDDKDWFKNQCDERKERIAKVKAEAKEEAKKEKELLKQVKLLGIKE